MAVANDLAHLNTTCGEAALLVSVAQHQGWTPDQVDPHADHLERMIQLEEIGSPIGKLEQDLVDHIQECPTCQQNNPLTCLACGRDLDQHTSTDHEPNYAIGH